jgi:hypothetical protein
VKIKLFTAVVSFLQSVCLGEGYNIKADNNVQNSRILCTAKESRIVLSNSKWFKVQEYNLFLQFLTSYIISKPVWHNGIFEHITGYK